MALACGPRLVGINNRDLRDFSVNLETTLRLRPQVPAGVCLVAESGIRTPAGRAQAPGCGRRRHARRRGPGDGAGRGRRRARAAGRGRRQRSPEGTRPGDHPREDLRADRSGRYAGRGRGRGGPPGIQLLRAQPALHRPGRLRPHPRCPAPQGNIGDRGRRVRQRPACYRQCDPGALWAGPGAVARRRAGRHARSPGRAGRSRRSGPLQKRPAARGWPAMRGQPVPTGRPCSWMPPTRPCMGAVGRSPTGAWRRPWPRRARSCWPAG